MARTTTKATIFRWLRQELSKKNVDRTRIAEAEKDIDDYVRRLEQSMSFSTTTPLKEFVEARR